MNRVKNCDCFIGFFGGEEVNKSNLEKQVRELVEIQPQLKEYGMLSGQPQTATQLVDGRKGYLSRFSFCPYCGEELDWKDILKNIKK